MIRLKRLAIEGCRGIKDGPDLNFSDGGMILQGDNGVGKSSYIDALEKVLTGSCSTVESGDQGISWARYGTNVECKKCCVELTVMEGNKPHKFQFDGKQCKFPPLEDFVGAAKQQSFILRRRVLLSFINCKPAERYRALEGFLNLSAFESFERGIKTARLAEEAKVSSKSVQIQASEQRIRTALAIPAHEVVSLERCVTSVNATLSKASLMVINGIAAATARLAEISARLASFSNIEELTNLTSLKVLLQEPPSIGEISADLKRLILAKARLAEEERNLRGLFFEEVLRGGLEWITRDNLKTCPLCGGQISLEDVKLSVEKRLSENSALTSYRTEVNDISISLAVLAPAALSALKTVRTAIRTPMDKEKYESLIAAENALVELSKVSANTAEENLRRLSGMLDAEAVQADVSSLAAAVNAALEDRPDEMNLFNNLTSASSALSCLQLQFAALEKLRGQHKTGTQRVANMKRIADHAEASRKKVVAEVVSMVAGLADGYFRKIHPDECIGSPSLEVAKVGTASLNLSSEFYSKVGDPRGLYSEGHIDSLGLCLFLAIRKLHQGQCPALSILVLDDVLHSVDGEHRKRTAELIFDEFSDHQLIITTHDPIWYRYLCQKAQKSGRPFTMKRIAGWSLAEGPKWGDHLADYEWLASPEGLRALPKDRASKAGRLLEELLQNCCDRTEAAVPFRIKGDYTIDPLWNAFYKKAKSNKGFLERARTCLEEIEATREIRNFGAHWNSWSQQLTAREAERFVKAVLALRTLTFCEECSDFFNEISELEDLWACKKLHLNYAKKGDIPVQSGA